jgi:hypothetical protein
MPTGVSSSDSSSSSRSDLEVRLEGELRLPLFFGLRSAVFGGLRSLVYGVNTSHNWLRVVGALFAATWLGAMAMSAAAVYPGYGEVRPILAALSEILPPALKAPTAPDAAWNDWVAAHDREIRSRLQRGDRDTLVNWLLLGTTFTSRPRSVVEPTTADVVQIPPLVTERVRDLIAALRSPGDDERRRFARRLLADQGYGVATEAERERLTDFLLTEVARVTREHATHARELAELRKIGNTTEEFAGRSRVFRTRGLSLDTSLLPGFALEQSLAALRARGLMKPGTVRNVAVIGPGLDFSDKSSGYDFYPQQTLQPFALVDSLVRIGLAGSAEDVQVTTLDLSPRVNDHLAAVRRRAAAGEPYVIRLPLDPAVPWRPEVLSYWDSAGDRIGDATSSFQTTADGQKLRVRAVRVRAGVARRIASEDVNVVVQRLAERNLDLVVATNVFVYYDVLDQVLALANVEAMLRPGGFLLSNNAILELPGSGVRSVGYLTVPYSARPDDGDHIVWYQKK